MTKQIVVSMAIQINANITRFWTTLVKKTSEFTKQLLYRCKMEKEHSTYLLYDI